MNNTTTIRVPVYLDASIDARIKHDAKLLNINDHALLNHYLEIGISEVDQGYVQALSPPISGINNQDPTPCPVKTAVLKKTLIQARQ